MAHSWNITATDEQLDEAAIRGKRVMADMQQVLTWTYQRVSVSEMARRLGCSRNTIADMWVTLRQVSGRAAAGFGRRPNQRRTGT